MKTPSFSMPAMTRKSKILLSIVIVLSVIAIILGALVGTGVIPMGRSARWGSTRPPGFSGNYYLKNSASQYVYFTTSTNVQTNGTYPVLSLVLQSTPGYPAPYSLTPSPENIYQGVIPSYTIQYSTSSNTVTLCAYNKNALGFVTPTISSVAQTEFMITPVGNNYYLLSVNDVGGKNMTYCLDTSNKSTYMSPCNSTSSTQLFTFSTT